MRALNSTLSFSHMNRPLSSPSDPCIVSSPHSDCWSHVKCSLGAMILEKCTAARGKCKATEESFKKGDVRLAVCSKNHKAYYSLAGMGDAVRPIVEASDGEYSASDITGFLALSKEERAAVCAAIDVKASASAKKRARRGSDVTVATVTVKTETVATVTVKTETDVKPVADTPASANRRSGRRSSAVSAPPAPATPVEDEKAAEDGDSDGLTEFERQREELIARNKARMAALNIGALAGEVAAASAKPANGPSQRGIGSKRKKEPKEDAGPPRRSLRGQKIAPDVTLAGGVDYERRDGTVILANGMYGGSGRSDSPPPPSRPTGDVKLDSVNGEESADEAFISFLRDTLSGVTASSAAFREGSTLKNDQGSFTSAKSIVGAKIKLTDEAVAKVTPRGVTHLDLAPYDPDGPIVAAAGDKDGNVGLWRVDYEAPGGADDEGDGSDDGVLFYKPHGAYICHLKWGRGGLAGRLLTCAYDGAVRTLDAEKGVFTELFVSEDEDEFSACDVTADGRSIHLSDNVGNYQVVDARSGKLTSPAVQLHEKKINTVHLEPGAERAVATSCGDQTVCVWDVRKCGKGAKPLSRLQHTKSCQAAYFAPNGSGELLTTCYDDLIRVWRPKSGAAAGAVNDDPKACLKIKHNNQTGRWVLPFRAVWTPAGDGVVIGSMRREVELFDSSSGKLAGKYSDAERMTAIASRYAVHPTKDIVAAGTASGRLHIYRK